MSITLCLIWGNKSLSLNRIDNPVFIVNAAAPKAFRLFFSGSGLPMPSKAASSYVFYQYIDTLQDSLVGLLPLAVVFPCVKIPLYPFYLHKLPIPQSIHVLPVSVALPCSPPFSFPDSGYCFRCKKGLVLKCPICKWQVILHDYLPHYTQILTFYFGYPIFLAQIITLFVISLIGCP